MTADEAIRDLLDISTDVKAVAVLGADGELIASGPGAVASDFGTASAGLWDAAAGQARAAGATGLDHVVVQDAAGAVAAAGGPQPSHRRRHRPAAGRRPAAVRPAHVSGRRVPRGGDVIMKRLLVILAGAAVGAAAVLWWRRRAQSSAPPPVQLGLADGGTVTLAASDPGAAQVTAAADVVRRAFVAGA